MKISPTFYRFDRATDAVFMLPFFRSMLNDVFGPRVTVERIEIPRAFYRDEDTCIIQYRIILKGMNNDSDSPLLFWGTLPGTKEKCQESSSLDRNLFWYDTSLELLVPKFPHDTRLGYLTELWQSTEVPSALSAWLTDQGCVDQSKVEYTRELLGYRVERRCVLRLRFNDMVTGGKLSCIAKVVRPKKAASVFASQEYLANCGFDKNSSDQLTVPTVYSYDSSTGLILMEYVEGTSIHDLIGSDSLVQACAQAGKVLVKMHNLRLPDVPVYPPRKEMGKLYESVKRTSELFPDLSLLMDGAMKELKDAAFADEECLTTCCIHGDYFDKQVLWSEERTTLLDCDNIMSGDPALDFGNFTAHMILRQEQSPDASGTIARAVENFTKGYMDFGQTDALFEERVIWWKSAALIRLACLYALRPRWRHLSEKLLIHAVGSMKETKRHVTGDV